MPILPSRALVLALTGAMNILAGCGSTEAAPTSVDPTIAASATDPVVLELFQSQGCSSCPPANAVLNGLADRPDILALSFAVTYWDQLGWKDSFGSPRYTARQQDYAAAGRGQVATPELIINGAYSVVGSNGREVATTIAKAGPPRGGPDIASTGDNGIRLGVAAAKQRSTVWLVRYDPRSRNVPIRAGENSGKTLPHRDIVRELVKLGDWSGAAATFALPNPREPGLAAAVLVQRGTGGPIIAARKI